MKFKVFGCIFIGTKNQSDDVKKISLCLDLENWILRERFFSCKGLAFAGLQFFRTNFAVSGELPDSAESIFFAQASIVMPFKDPANKK